MQFFFIVINLYGKISFFFSPFLQLFPSFPFFGLHLFVYIEFYTF